MITLNECLSTSKVMIKFTKADGTDRIMLATTNHELITYEFPQNYDATKKADKTNGVIKVWDIEKAAWRSIREDRVISWEIT